MPFRLMINPLLAVLALALGSGCQYGEAVRTDGGLATAPQAIEAPAPAFAQLEAAMASYVKDGRVVGIATRMIQDGAVVSDMHAGFRDREASLPMTQDTIFRIYSMTKPVTAVAMMQLWEAGAFKLDDPVTDYIPEFANLLVLDGTDEAGAPVLAPTMRPPTIRELMTHTAGFAYGLGGSDPANAAFRERDVLRSPDLETFIARVADIPLLFQPGEAWSYSAATDIQGYLIEKLSGKTLADYMRDSIFSPLGMSDTGFFVPEGSLDRFAAVYAFDRESGDIVPVDAPFAAFREDTVAMPSAGGGLVSTMDDYARFCQMLLNGGTLDGVRVLQPETVALIGTDQVRTSQVNNGQSVNVDKVDPGLGIGLNLGVITDPGVSQRGGPAGTMLWSGAAGTWFWIDPENRIAFIGMIQLFDNAPGGRQLDLPEASSRLVYETLMPDRPREP